MRQALAHRIADDDERVVDVLVAQLRQKIEAEPLTPTILLTEPGIGCRLTPEDEA